MLSAVYIDGEFAMSLDTRTLLENRVDVGKELDDEELRALIDLSNERRAKEKADAYCSNVAPALWGDRII